MLGAAFFKVLPAPILQCFQLLCQRIGVFGSLWNTVSNLLEHPRLEAADVVVLHDKCIQLSAEDVDDFVVISILVAVCQLITDAGSRTLRRRPGTDSERSRKMSAVIEKNVPAPAAWFVLPVVTVIFINIMNPIIITAFINWLA